MTDVGLCRECGREQKLTPKNGNTVRHKGCTGTNGVYDSPVCKGSGKLPVLVRPCICGTCMSQTLFRADGRMARHRNEDGAWCEMEMGEAAMEIKDQLGAVEASVNAAATQHSAQQAAMSRKSDTAEIQPMLNPERPTESLEESHRLSATGSGVPLPTKTSGNGTAPSTDSPPSSSAMFGDAGATVRAKPRKRVPLEGEALALSNWFDDLFFRYQHSRERSMQPTIGPSEIGSQCMRRIAMKLSQRPEVNFEKDTYAAWFGTQGHLGLEEMLRWANQTMHAERFLIEAPLEFGSEAMPHGHSDAFDRRPDAVGFDRLQGIVIDWKFPGTSALSKMHLDGISLEYETQGHLYGYGQRLAGENVERVAVIALPRQTGDLSGKFVWVAPYDEEIAIKAIKKAEAIKKRLDELGPEGYRQAPKTPSYLCPFCPFYLANDAAEVRGCSG